MPRSASRSDAIKGRAVAVALMLSTLIGLAAVALTTRLDKAQRQKLDTFSKSTAPLPTPPPRSENDEEMDPDKAGESRDG